jgi:hypothetical protein
MTVSFKEERWRCAVARNGRWVGEWRMEEWKGGRLEAGSILGRQVQHSTTQRLKNLNLGTGDREM